MVTQRAAHAAPVLVTLPDEIDVANAHAVRERITAAFEPGVSVVVADMTATTFCDTMGIRALVLAHQRAAAGGAELRLLVTSPAVLRIMGILRVDTLLHVCLGLDDALAGEPMGQPGG